MSLTSWGTWGRRWGSGSSSGRAGRRRGSTGTILLRQAVGADEADATDGGGPSRARSVWYVPSAVDGDGADGADGGEGAEGAQDSGVWLNERHDPCEKRGMSRWYVYQSPVSLPVPTPVQCYHSRASQGYQWTLWGYEVSVSQS